MNYLSLTKEKHKLFFLYGQPMLPRSRTGTILLCTHNPADR